NLFEIYHQRMASYIPVPIATRMLCIVSESNKQSLEYNGGTWRHFSSQNEVVIVPGDHSTCVTSRFFADSLRARLEALDADVLQSRFEKTNNVEPIERFST